MSSERPPGTQPSTWSPGLAVRLRRLAIRSGVRRSAPSAVLGLFVGASLHGVSVGHWRCWMPLFRVLIDIGQQNAIYVSWQNSPLVAH
jgi:hypothetical protein